MNKDKCRGKGNGLPVHVVQVYRRSRVLGPLILNLDA